MAEPSDSSRAPRCVFVFSGHMIDAPTRAEPRFPSRLEAAAAARIAQEMDRHHAGPGDVALTQGAAGGDLLFAEASLARGVTLALLLPLPEDEFIRQSILPSDQGEHWRERYLAVRQQVAGGPQCLDDAGPARAQAAVDDEGPFVRCNEWLIDEAFRRGAGRVCFICLWNGGGGDGPGGTAHMVDEVRRRGGDVVWIDTRSL